MEENQADQHFFCQEESLQKLDWWDFDTNFRLRCQVSNTPHFNIFSLPQLFCTCKINLTAFYEGNTRHHKRREIKIWCFQNNTSVSFWRKNTHCVQSQSPKMQNDKLLFPSESLPRKHLSGIYYKETKNTIVSYLSFFLTGQFKHQYPKRWIRRKVSLWTFTDLLCNTILIRAWFYLMKQLPVFLIIKLLPCKFFFQIQRSAVFSIPSSHKFYNLFM